MVDTKIMSITFICQNCGYAIEHKVKKDVDSIEGFPVHFINREEPEDVVICKKCKSEWTFQFSMLLGKKNNKH